ncbi:MAG: GFA family protein [Gammaproteobacteria bacterium]|nr:GFA family protein [Gammaproteobacteria bacterium]
MSGESINGGCHCGNLRYTLDWPDGGSEIPARRCGCSFCRKHGGIWTSNPDARLLAQIADPSQLSRYQFGTVTAHFYICSNCGAAPFVVSEIDDTLYAVVNVNTLEKIDSARFDESATDFDGEDTDSRLERRKKNWIPDVTIAFGQD